MSFKLTSAPNTEVEIFKTNYANNSRSFATRDAEVMGVFCVSARVAVRTLVALIFFWASYVRA